MDKLFNKPNWISKYVVFITWLIEKVTITMYFMD